MVEMLLRGVAGMKESTTYQAILEEGEAIGVAKGRAEGKAEGRAEEARKLLVLLGRVRLGEPSAEIVARLDAVSDLGQLESLMIRSIDVKTWEELLDTNGKARQPRGRRKT
jgi:predicted transposase YdaD